MKKIYGTLLGILFIGGMLFSGCKPEDVTDPVPTISLINVTPTTITALSDSIHFEIFYTDGDGDLGENNPDVENLFIVDPRIGSEYPFRIPQLSPDGATITIQGTLTVSLSNVGITDGSSEQAVTFSVYVKDRAGNESNRVDSPVVTIME